MVPVLFWLGVFVISLIVLVKSSDYFTHSAEKVGLSLRIPPFIVGVTIVALGTSLPELASSLFAVIDGSPQIVAGNVVGSNIANIFLVLGVAAIVSKKLKITYELISVDLPLLMGSTFLLVLMLWDGVFVWYEGILSLLLLGGYLHYTTRSQERDVEIIKEMADKKPKRGTPVWPQVVILIASSAFLFLSAKYTIDSVIALSNLLGVATELIAVSAVALGTSLPELLVSVNAARRGNAEIAVGNVLGSNIFNALAVMGIPAFIQDLPVAPSLLAFSVPVLIAATLLYYFVTQNNEITKWEGGMLLIFYAFFVVKLFV